MKKILKVHFQRIWSLFVLCVLCVAMFLGGQMTAPVAYADTAIGDVQMDSSNVMDDLQSSTVDGEQMPKQTCLPLRNTVTVFTAICKAITGCMSMCITLAG